VQSTAEDLPEDLAETAINEYTLRVYQYQASGEEEKNERSVSQFLDVFGLESYTCYVRQGFLEKTEPETPEVEETQNPYWFSPWQVQSSAYTETPTPTKPQKNVFLCENTQAGTALTNAENSIDCLACYVGEDQIVYTRADNLFGISSMLYIKSVHDTTEGKPLMKEFGAFPCYVGKGQIVYVGLGEDGNNMLYLKNIHDELPGTPLDIEAGNYGHLCYVGNGQIIYSEFGDDYKLYIKNLYDNSPSQYLNVKGIFACYVGNGQIVYHDMDNYDGLCLKNIQEGAGKSITQEKGTYLSPCYVGAGKIVYRTPEGIYLKSIYDNHAGAKIVALDDQLLYVFAVMNICYIGNGKIVYVNQDPNDRMRFNLCIKDLYEYL
jgi:hypothetical protein